jgi:two-component system, NarL family, sensor kinase
LLSSLRSDTAAAIAEVRRLVEGLRPPALDQLGLVGSLRQRAVRIFAADGRPLSVSVDAPEPMPEIPAAVEVAAYRIVTEALTIRVRDYGQDSGMWTPGVGLSSMQERAQQLGGSCEATATVTGGLVTARLPIM